MKFMLLIHDDERRIELTAMSGTSPEHAAYGAALAKAGAMLGGERLRPTSTATSVRVRQGKTEVLDGPYAETREQFAGYYLIEAPDMDAAMDWAARCPSAQTGTLEVRTAVEV